MSCLAGFASGQNELFLSLGRRHCVGRVSVGGGRLLKLVDSVRYGACLACL